ncbi:MAG: hypothetical protein COX57_06040 [Alphaproteobacteria bacterium CG_4_10_14_0_2_um_filter_63_37]|nr:MAG: hypothetical protein AUJ55_01520 [Proteobacteria bacterium CG1_02_64_396]PJA24874.1 MAG: hypothetical protein COX57_06040 [Alphaproteobacteria bacterium CG_4_10_14_0_2_um_filter_63_37]
MLPLLLTGCGYTMIGSGGPDLTGISRVVVEVQGEGDLRGALARHLQTQGVEVVDRNGDIPRLWIEVEKPWIVALSRDLRGVVTEGEVVVAAKGVWYPKPDVRQPIARVEVRLPVAMTGDPTVDDARVRQGQRQAAQALADEVWSAWGSRF